MPRALLTRFRVNPDHDRAEYFTVKIYRTRDAMSAAYLAIGAPGDSRKADFRAVTIPQVRSIVWSDGRSTTHPEQGAILFYQKWIGTQTVSHEMTHAAVYYLETIEGVDWSHLKTDHALEERLCHVQGYLVGEFWWKWIAVKRRLARTA